MTKHRTTFAALAAILLSAGAVHADPVYDTCIDQSDGTNAAWSACGGAWLKREDDRLNTAWRNVFSKATGQTKTDLLVEQRAWIDFKEKSCAFLANGDFGREGQALHFASCRAGVISERTGALDRIRGMLDGEM